MKTAVRILVGAAIAAVLGSCSLFDYSGMVTHKYALVYGVTNYVWTGDSHLTPQNSPNLTYPDADARDMAALLRANGYTVVLRYVDGSDQEWLQGPTDPSPVPTALISTDTTGASGPSKANIPLDIAAYFSGVVGANDLFLLYFSGHGGQITSTVSAREYVIPMGAVVWDGAEYGFVTGSSIRDDELTGYLSVLATNRKVVILDTCNSGGFIGNRLESDALPQNIYLGGNGGVTASVIAEAISNYESFPVSATGMSPSAATVISAAGRDELSYEGGPFSNGVMTHFLLQTAQSGDLDKDGHVTVNEAYALIKAGVDQLWNKYVIPQEAFDPHISGGPVDFVLF